MLLVLRNETQANSLTRSLFLVDFEAVSASLLACDVIIAKKMGRQIKRPLRSNLKRKTTRWPGGGEAGAGGVLHIKGKGREKEKKRKKILLQFPKHIQRPPGPFYFKSTRWEMTFFKAIYYI